MSNTGFFAYDVLADWPQLAWVATWTSKKGALSEVTVHCGCGVERHPLWFGECVWAGDFGEGNFHVTESVFGTGARATNSAVFFVSAASTVDRLYIYERDEVKCVSNSLIALSKVAGVEFDCRYAHYFTDFHTINRGLGRYRAYLPTLGGGQLRLVYHDNIVWDGSVLSIVPKKQADLTINGFEAYREFLRSQIAGLIKNAEDTRRGRLLGPLATLSNGYDSTAVCAVASAVGLRECIGFDERYPDSAADLQRTAHALDLKLDLRQRKVARTDNATSVAMFLASGTVGYESHFLQIEDALRDKLLLTGFHGDVVWGLSHRSSHPLQRAGPSGLSVTEYRLQVPFIHAPIPFLGARQLNELTALGKSPEMTPWRVGGRYDRPLARRLAEDRGVPRNSFGTSKRIASITFSSSETVADSVLAEMSEWLHVQWKGYPPWRYRLLKASDRPRQMAAGFLQKVGRYGKRRPLLVRLAGGLRGRLIQYPIFRYAFPWAIRKLTEGSPSRSLVNESKRIELDQV